MLIKTRVLLNIFEEELEEGEVKKSSYRRV